MKIQTGQQARLKYSIEPHFGQDEIVTFSGWTMNEMYEFITKGGHRTFTDISNVEILEVVPLIDWDAISKEWDDINHGLIDFYAPSWFKEQVSKYVK